MMFMMMVLMAAVSIALIVTGHTSELGYYMGPVFGAYGFMFFILILATAS